jgi:hypothetical protein
MPVKVEEQFSGRRKSGRSAERRFTITGASSEADARNNLLTSANVPTSISGMVRVNEDCSVEEIATNLFVGTAVYASPSYEAPAPANTFSISFDISGQNIRVKQSRETLGIYKRQTDPNYKDFKQAIGVNADGTVEGCDIIVPVPVFTVNHTFEDADLPTYRELCSVVGKTNNATFMNFTVDELLLTRVSGQQREDGKWDLSFGFGVSLTETITSIGDVNKLASLDQVAVGAGIKKVGWSYLWCYYEDQVDDTNHVIRQVPTYCYVERVYPQANYGLLKIGGDDRRDTIALDETIGIEFTDGA